MANIFSAFGNYGALGSALTNIGIFIVVLILVGVPLVGLVIFIMMKMKEKKIEEVNIENKRIKNFSAREKKSKSGQIQFYVGGKYKKFLPRVQAKDVFIKGKQDKIYLLKDNNGLHHTLRIPTIAELQKWYQVVYGVDITSYQTMKQSEHGKELFNILSTVYLLPNPAEDNSWLADQCMDADKKYATGLLKHPAIVWISTLALCAFVFIITIIITKRM